LKTYFILKLEGI